MQRSLKATVVAAVLAAVGASALAANISFTGNLAGDNGVQLFSFSLAVDADVTLRTLSYAGGVNAAGTLIDAGGFDPVIALFDGSGGGAILFNGDDDSGPGLDALLQLTPLLVGTYTVALSQVANFANGPTLGDGFLGFGNPGFDGRSSAWALDILGVDSASAVPEPTTLALMLLGVAVVAGLGRSRPRR
jgi:hypothetical protein